MPFLSILDNNPSSDVVDTQHNAHRPHCALVSSDTCVCICVRIWLNVSDGDCSDRTHLHKVSLFFFGTAWVITLIELHPIPYVFVEDATSSKIFGRF
ncbi:hypothetical protein CAEBREN_05320 [Caenorhabditis brenneri]|uniref:Uncharacterized protein n=1 Tax=Caenorhabditis brenneri TaxID=135651 RepID=G0MUK0_CAEBE|nr:hypothetical protein CAEBREN_05320 [Caenorhabditis brenneri]